MKRSPVLNVLVALIAILALITAAAGLFSAGGPGRSTFTTLRGQSVEIFGEGLYRYDTVIFGAGFRGTDAMTLIVALPLLLIAFAAAWRGSKNAEVLLAAALFFFLYNGASMTFSAAFNPMFLLYTAQFSAAVFAVIVALASIDQAGLAQRVGPGFPHKRMGAFLIFAGVATQLLWLSDLIGPLLSGQAPANLGPYTTMYTHAFDSALITPACILAGVLVLQRRPLGYLLAAPVLILCVLVGAAVIGQTISQVLAGLIFPVGVYIGMVGSWVVMGALAAALSIAYFRNLPEQPAAV